MVKKITALLLCVIGVLCMFSGCGGGSTGNEKLSVVCTIFPQYDWVREILGDEAENAELTLLMDSGTDLHSYQATAADLVKISSCDLFIYVGGTSDAWVGDALKNSVNSEMKTINMMELLKDRVYEEETVDGMQHEHEDEAEDEAEDEHDHKFETELDEHVWLSLKNADIVCTAIKDALCEINPENKDVYTANCGVYRQALNVLEGDYEAAAAAAKTKTLLFCDRFPFRYLIEDYALDYYAAFPGCSAESEASFETVAFLAAKVDELSLKSIFVTETSDQSLAKTIIQNTKSKDLEIKVLNSLQSVTAADVAAGQTYIKAMSENLESLKSALS